MDTEDASRFKAFAYIRIPKSNIDTGIGNEIVIAAAFETRHAGGLSMFRADIASPLYVIQQLLETARDDAQRQWFGGTPEGVIESGRFRIAIIKLASIEERGFRCVGLDAVGHVDIVLPGVESQNSPEAKREFLKAGEVWKEREHSRLLIPADSLLTVEQAHEKIELW